MIIHKHILITWVGEGYYEITIKLPKDANIIKFAFQKNESKPSMGAKPTIWYMFNEEETEKDERSFLIVSTGVEFSTGAGTHYIGTAFILNGVYHLFGTY